MTLRRRLVPSGLLAASMLMLLAHPALAEQNLQTNISETGSWESNPLMQIGSVKSLYGSTTAPELIFNDNTPTIKLSSDTVIDANVFNQSEFNSVDGHETLNFQDQGSPRWGYGTMAKLDYDTTRTSEVSNFGLAPNKSFRHTGLSVAPDVTYNPTAIDQFTLKGSAALSDYADNVYSDYDLFTIDPTYAHNFDPLNAGTFDVLAQQYQTTSGPSNKVDAITPSIGWQRLLSPRFSIKGSVGPQFARQTGVQSKDWSLSYNFMGDLSFKGSQDTIDASATRAESPFGNGTESLSDIFELKGQHQLNELFSVGLDASYETAEYQASVPLSLDTLTSANLSLTYHVTEHVDVVSAYTYRHETYTGTSGTADDNLATINLAYHPKAWGL